MLTVIKRLEKRVPSHHPTQSLPVTRISSQSFPLCLCRVSLNTVAITGHVEICILLPCYVTFKTSF